MQLQGSVAMYFPRTDTNKKTPFDFFPLKIKLPNT